MRVVTRTETKAGTDARSTTMTRARCNRTTDCHCGQQLDMNVRAHCPRCGRSVSQS
jgi:hypothetical protein